MVIILTVNFTYNAVVAIYLLLVLDYQKKKFDFLTNTCNKNFYIYVHNKMTLGIQWTTKLYEHTCDFSLISSPIFNYLMLFINSIKPKHHDFTNIFCCDSEK